MTIRELTIGAAAAAACLVTATGSLAQSQPASVPSRLSSTQPDNTANNRPERAGSAPTADEQKNDPTDLDMTQRVRRTLMDDKSLSTSAHNVKVIAAGGTVTLKGVVLSARERELVAAKAVSIAGEGHVVNQLEVAPK